MREARRNFKKSFCLKINSIKILRVILSLHANESTKRWRAWNHLTQLYNHLCPHPHYQLIIPKSPDFAHSRTFKRLCTSRVLTYSPNKTLLNRVFFDKNGRVKRQIEESSRFLTCSFCTQQRCQSPKYREKIIRRWFFGPASQ